MGVQGGCAVPNSLCLVAAMSSITSVPGRLDPLDWLKSSWISRRNLPVLLGAILALQVLGFGRLLSGSDGLTDSFGRLLGADFSALWAAGRAALAGETASPYQLAWFVEHLRLQMGEHALRLAWSYPPVLYLAVAPLGILSYSAALAVWLGASLSALAAAARAIVRDPLVWLAILAFPGLYANGVQGQTGFLTGALLAGGLYCVDKRPVMAGMLFAALAYKPQFGVLLPIALMAGGHWRVIVSAAVTGCFLLAASSFFFGVESWSAWLAGLAETRQNTLDAGAGGFYLMASLFALVRQLGGSAWLAYSAQVVLLIGLAVALAAMWRAKADTNLRNAGTAAAALLATPYCMDYDLAALGAALAFLAAYGLHRPMAPWSHTLMAIAFVAPPLARFSGFFLGLPLGFLACLSLFSVALANWRYPAQR